MSLRPMLGEPWASGMRWQKDGKDGRKGEDGWKAFGLETPRETPGDDPKEAEPDFEFPSRSMRT